LISDYLLDSEDFGSSPEYEKAFKNHEDEKLLSDFMGVIEVQVPEGLPLNALKKKIDDLVKEEEARWALFEGSREKLNLSKTELAEHDKIEEKITKEDRKKILDKYYRIIKLNRPVSLEEILDLEEDTWLY